MEKKINVAIVGYGGMARCWHIKRLKEMTDIFEIVGAYDIDPERNRLFEEDSGVKAFSSMDELLNSGKVELAIVAVPNDVHKPVCIRLLEHKINVICEKPVCLSSEELEAMIAPQTKTAWYSPHIRTDVGTKIFFPSKKYTMRTNSEKYSA